MKPANSRRGGLQLHEGGEWEGMVWGSGGVRGESLYPSKSLNTIPYPAEIRNPGSAHVTAIPFPQSPSQMVAFLTSDLRQTDRQF